MKRGLKEIEIRYRFYDRPEETEILLGGALSCRTECASVQVQPGEVDERGLGPGDKRVVIEQRLSEPSAAVVSNVEIVRRAYAAVGKEPPV